MKFEEAKHPYVKEWSSIYKAKDTFFMPPYERKRSFTSSTNSVSIKMIIFCSTTNEGMNVAITAFEDNKYMCNILCYTCQHTVPTTKQILKRLKENRNIISDKEDFHYHLYKRIMEYFRQNKKKLKKFFVASFGV